MSLSTDALLERIRLKSQLLKWRALAVILGSLLALLWYGDTPDIVGRNYIARVTISGLLQESYERDQKLRELAEDSNVEAIIVYINTPGGTVVGGESIYNTLKRIGKDKPIVSVMGTMATSAGYMVALGTEYIFASKGTLTGSIGVILHAAEVLGLAKKIGVNFNIIKSGPFKASPSPFEKLTPEGRKAIQDVIDNFYGVFVDMVIENRKLSEKEVKKIADGRVFTGLQALDNKLIDAIGTEEDAVAWLIENKGVSTEKVEEVDLYKEKSKFEALFGSLSEKSSIMPKILSLQGLLSVWADGII